MDIAATGRTGPAFNTTGQAPAPTSDFDTFLRLLTAQIRNQDPLEPTDSTEYTAQLATFSNVEQAVETNTLLGQMIARLDTQQISDASNWIDMEVRHAGLIGYDGNEKTVYTNVNPTADRAELVVYDLEGTEIGRQPIDPDAESATWPAPGLAADLEHGGYFLEVESWAGDQALSNSPVDHYGTVSEVVLGPDGAELVLDGLIRLPVDALQAIRRPGA